MNSDVGGGGGGGGGGGRRVRSTKLRSRQNVEGMAGWIWMDGWTDGWMRDAVAAAAL